MRDGNSPRGLIPKRGDDLSEYFGYGERGIKGLIWRRPGHYSPWVAKCQICNYEWDVRPRPWNTPYKMPIRCPGPGCRSRKWSDGFKISNNRVE